MSLLFEALRDLAESTLGCKSCQPGNSVNLDVPGAQDSCMGGLVRLSSGTTALHVGVLATREDCTHLARRLLGRPGDDRLPESVVRGAMCKLAYLLASSVKRRLSFAGEIMVGQPAFFAGAVERRAGWNTRTTHVELDAMRATLISVERSEKGLLL
jgi:hypothetical protein